MLKLVHLYHFNWQTEIVFLQEPNANSVAWNTHYEVIQCSLWLEFCEKTMTKLLNSDWLFAVQFFINQVQKRVNSEQFFHRILTFD